MNKEIKKYLKDIKSTFPSYVKEEKEFYKRFKTNIINQTLNEDINYEECINRFGTPKDIAIDFYNEMNPELYLKKVKKVQVIKKITITLLSCFVLLSIFLAILLYKDYLNSQESRIDSTEEVIEIIE